MDKIHKDLHKKAKAKQLTALVRKVLKVTGMSAKELAEHMGVSGSAVSCWLSGKNGISKGCRKMLNTYRINGAVVVGTAKEEKELSEMTVAVPLHMAEDIIRQGWNSVEGKFKCLTMSEQLKMLGKLDAAFEEVL